MIKLFFVKKIKAIYWFLLLIFAVFAWLVRPWLHGPLMLSYRHPLLIVFIIFAALFVYWLRKRHVDILTKNDKGAGAKRLVLILALICVAVFIFIPELFSPAVFIGFILYLYRRSIGTVKRLFFLGGGILLVAFLSFVFFESELAYLITAKTITFQPRNVFPKVQPVRILPKLIATRYANDALQNPQEKLGDSQIALVDGKLKRVFPRLPDGTLLYYIKKMTGFITIDVSSLRREATIEDQSFKYSEGVGIFDNIYFQLYKKKFFVDYVDQPIYLKDLETNRWVTVVPYISYRYFPIRIPVWGGFMTVDSDGQIIDHKPEEASMLSLTRGNRVYLRELARYYTESFAYKGGLLNKWFFHKDQPEIDELEDELQPYHIATVEGLKQAIFTKPVGKSFGIFKIFLFDATTGQREIIEFSQGSLLSGPVAALDYTKRAFPTIDYTTFKLLEPRPVMVKGHLYWLVSIGGNTGAGVAYTALVDSKTTEVIAFGNERELQAFIDGN